MLDMKLYLLTTLENEIIVKFVGEPIFVPNNVKVTIDCSLFLDYHKLMAEDFCVIWDIDGIPVTHNTSSYGISQDRQQLSFFPKNCPLPIATDFAVACKLETYGMLETISKRNADISKLSLSTVSL